MGKRKLTPQRPTVLAVIVDEGGGGGCGFDSGLSGCSLGLAIAVPMVVPDVSCSKPKPGTASRERSPLRTSPLFRSVASGRMVDLFPIAITMAMRETGALLFCARSDYDIIGILLSI